MTLTFLQPGNFTLRKKIPEGKKRDRSPSSRALGLDCSSPSKKSVPAQWTEELPKVNGSPEPPAEVNNELLSIDEQVKVEKQVEAEVVPDLCGMREVRDCTAVSSIFQTPWQCYFSVYFFFSMVTALLNFGNFITPSHDLIAQDSLLSLIPRLSTLLMQLRNSD